MSVGRLPSVLGPVFTDADWSQDFRFYVGSTSTEQSWSGVQGAISFVRQGLPRARFTLSSAAGSLVVLSNGLGIRLPASEMAKRLPGTYDFELRRIEGDGDTIALLVGQVTIAAGLSASSPAVPGGAVSGATGGTVQSTISDGAVAATLAPAGPTGTSAKEAAIAAGAIAAGSTDADFTAYLREPAVTAASDAAAATAAAQAVVDQEAATLADIEAKRVETLGYRDAAEDHKLAAQAAASAVVTDKYTRIGSRFDAEGFEFPGSVKAVATSGFLLAGDGGHALYKRVNAMPAHAGRFRSVDRLLADGVTVDAANGGWWELVDLELKARQFGAKADGSDDLVALQAFLDAMILTGRAGDIGPGVFVVSNTLRLNTTGNANQPVCGLTLRGAGMARIDGGWPANTAGTRIDYNGAAGAIDAIIRVEPAFTRYLKFQDFTLSGTLPSSEVVGGTTIYTLPVQNGIKFAETTFSEARLDRVGFKYVQRCVGVYRVAGSNGEYVSMMNCLGSSVGQAFYCNNQQAYYHNITDCGFVCYPNNSMFECTDAAVSGIGLQIKNVSGGFYPADAAATSTLLKYDAGSTVKWQGGRIEHLTKLVETSKGSAAAAATISFDSVEGTILSDPVTGAGEIRFVELLGNENTSPIVVENCNFSISTATKRDLIVYAPTARGHITFRNTVFQNVRNVIPFSGVNYGVGIEFEKCFIDGAPTGTQSAWMNELTAAHGLERMRAQHFGSENAMIGSGRRRNLLLESSFGFSPSTANSPALWTPPAPWVVTGGGGQVKNAFRWPNGFADQAWESAFGFVMVKDQKVEQALSNVVIGAATLLRYRALVSIGWVTAPNGFAEPVRFALVDGTNPANVYAERRFRPTSNGTSSPQVVDLTRWFSQASGTPRLLIENKHDGDVRITIYWQLASDHLGPVAFVPAAAAPVPGSKDWGAVVHNAAILERLQLPYKNDAYGTDTTLAELQPGEVYLSKNDDRLAMYANGKWKRSPVFDAKSGAPASGTYALGEVTFNTSPAAAGKAAWICVSAGSPGIHKPWGAIDA